MPETILLSRLIASMRTISTGSVAAAAVRMKILRLRFSFKMDTPVAKNLEIYKCKSLLPPRISGCKQTNISGT
jgi:hypothetical protein